MKRLGLGYLVRQLFLGESVNVINTPALIVDMENYESNLKHMEDVMEKYPDVALRPHAKAHKSCAVSIDQLNHAGAMGICGQKLTEVENLCKGNVRNLLLSNEVVEKTKLERLASLLCFYPDLDLSMCFDDVDIILQAAEIFEYFGVMMNCLVEIDIGQNRCGVTSVDDLMAIIEVCFSQPHLHFKGVQAYHGNNQHVKSFEERKSNCHVGLEKLSTYLDAMKSVDVSCEVVTGGGTGDFEFVAASGLYTDVQPGSWIFMDQDYCSVENIPFRQSLYVLSTVISKKQNPTRIVLDCGSKGISFDCGLPLFLDFPALEYTKSGDEHGRIFFDTEDKKKLFEDFEVGQKVVLLPAHCDPTTNKYDQMLGVRNFQSIEKVFDVSARGPGF